METTRRKQMIEACMRDLVEAARNDPTWLESIFRQGFVGFENMADDALEQAFVDAGLDE